jgi:ABC-2 type transport system permease protein
MTLSFWLVRIDNLSALTDTVVFVGRYPPDIFPRVLNFGLTFVLPLAFIAAVPTKALLGTLGPGMVAAGLAIAAGFLLAAALFWRYAARAYTSASS